ncbi:MAG: BON domain-containing protein [Chitinophagales bacterium]
MKKQFSLLGTVLVFILPWMLVTSCGESDAKVQAAIDASILENKDLSGIAAAVKDGVVTLTGECKDEMAKSTVESLIGKIKGVKQVINNCTIAPPPPAPVVIAADDPLSKGVTDATKDYPGVKGSVQDGVITLTGEIKKADLKKLMMSLNTLKPKKIDNKLTIK